METSKKVESPNINILVARSFINTVSFAVFIDNSGVTQINPRAGLQASLHTDAQLQVIYDLAKLTNDKSAVLAEYDRMIEMLASRGQVQGSEALKGSRDSLVSLLKQAESH